MNILTRYDLTPVKILKIFGLVVGGLLILAIVLQLFGASFRSLFYTGRGGLSALNLSSTAYDMAAPSYKSGGSVGQGMPELSMRNIVPVPPTTGTTGSDAESYEVKNFNGTIETRHLKETCGTIAEWKSKTFVIFESANEEDQSCYYSFKIEKSHTDEVMGWIKILNPKTLAENTQTIKNSIDDYTGELDILNKKKETIEKTLDSAVRAYDEITGVATRANDASSLAKIIDSKLQMIERLTQERIDVSGQIERLGRAKADQLDRIKYTSVSLQVYENPFVDGQNLKDSWKTAIKNFVRDVNEIAQSVTVGLVKILLIIVQMAIYFVIILFVVKYAWKFTKYIWKK